MIADKDNNFDHSIDYTQMAKVVKMAIPDFN
jgi:hypothetical protein